MIVALVLVEAVYCACFGLLSSNWCHLQIYTEYVQASEALFAEKEENKKLNEYMNQILKV